MNLMNVIFFTKEHLLKVSGEIINANQMGEGEGVVQWYKELHNSILSHPNSV